MNTPSFITSLECDNEHGTNVKASACSGSEEMFYPSDLLFIIDHKDIILCQTIDEDKVFPFKVNGSFEPEHI